MPAASDPFPQHRANVGITLFNTEGLVWLGRRDQTPPPWQWQLPQGGIDEGEDPASAALRELEEETGIPADQVTPLDRIEDWLAYDYPPDVRDDPWFSRKRHLGQKQLWFAFRFLGDDAAFDLERHGEVEFDDWRWAPLASTPDLIIPWKRDVYVEMARRFAHLAVQPG